MKAREAYQKPRRVLRFVNRANTVRVTEGFNDSTARVEWWLEFWVEPGEFVRQHHWRYNSRTTMKCVCDNWVSHYCLRPMTEIKDRRRLHSPAVDEWNA